jgi:hypothetical protein
MNTILARRHALSLYWAVVIILAIMVMYLLRSHVLLYDPMNLYTIVQKGHLDSVTPHGGIGVLPRPVLNAMEGMHHVNAVEYSLMGTFAKDPLLSQRMAEGAWPSRRIGSSSLVVGFIGELNATEECTLLWSKNDVALARCRR